MKKYCILFFIVLFSNLAQAQLQSAYSVRDSSQVPCTVNSPTLPISTCCVFSPTSIGKDTPINNVSATDGYGCSATASFVVNALSNPILLPTVSYQPYTTCDLRADSIVFAPYLPVPPSPLPIPYTPPIPPYTYTWHATNIAAGFASSGTIIGGVSYSHSLPIRFADSLIGSEIMIRATDSNGCYDEVRIWVEPCCVRSEPLISNTRLSVFFTDSTQIGPDGVYNLTGYSYRINGTFLIDRNCQMTSGNFYMEPYSQIVIAPDVKVDITQKVIVACDTTMWKGIIIGRNSVLNVANSRIYDAIIGISTRPLATFKLLYSYMNRNYIDVDVRAYNLGTNPSRIKECHLFSHNEIIEHYGNTAPRSGGRCWYPHNYEQSSIGIRINQNRNFMVGDTLVDTAFIFTGSGLSNNYIEDKLYGIHCTESGLESYNNHFKNIRVIPGYCDIFSGVFVRDSAGNGIYYEALNDLPARGKKLIVKHCTFDRINHAGIATTGAFTQGDIIRNRMTNVLHGILNNNITNTIAYKPLNIDSNYIAFHAIGIGCNNVRRMNIHIIADTLIASNVTFTVCGPRNKTGIRIAMPGLDASGNSMIAIRNNLILNGSSGIELQNINTMPTGIIRNSIISNTLQSTLTDRGYTGVLLNNSHNISIGWNTISGRAGVPGDRTSLLANKKGILLNSSSINTINCNSFDYLFKGLEYIGNCRMNSRLFNNQFNHLGNHIFCSDTLGILGNVRTAGMGSPYFHGNSMNFTAANYSIYNRGAVINYRRQGFANFNPWSPSTFTIPFTPIGAIPANSTFPLSLCTAAPPLMRLTSDSSTITDTVSYAEASELIDGVIDEESYTPDNIGFEIMSKEQIYDMLIRDSILGDIDSIAQFILVMQDEDIAIYSQIQEAILAQNYSYALALTASLDNTSYVNQAYEQWYSLYSTIDNVSNQYNVLYEDSLLIDSLIENECEPIQVFYNLNENEINQLIELANRCPYRYGQGVYNARVLINTQRGFEDLAWDDEAICNSSIGYKRNQIDTDLFSEAISNPNISIYPNPASTSLYYSIRSIDKNKCEQIESIKIYSGSGTLIQTQGIEKETKEGSIDISKYSEGIYIIYFKCIDGTNVMYKFVVNK